MEDVMFVHKSNPLTAGFACAAAAMVMGLAAGPAQAADQQDSYCSAPEVCNQRQIGIIQKTRDGVNYFYGGSAVAPPTVSYSYLIGYNDDQPFYEPILSTNLFATGLATGFEAPLSNHRFRMKNDRWKWNRRKPGLLDIPGANRALDIPGANKALDIPGVGLGHKHTAP
jgi:hypothetical protein